MNWLRDFLDWLLRPPPKPPTKKRSARSTASRNHFNSGHPEFYARSGAPPRPQPAIEGQPRHKEDGLDAAVTRPRNEMVVRSAPTAPAPHGQTSSPAPTRPPGFARGPSPAPLNLPARPSSSEPTTRKSLPSSRSETGRSEAASLFLSESSAHRTRWKVPPRVGPTGIAADAGSIGELELRAASIVGPSHRIKPSYRQDAYRIGVSVDGRYLVVAVADGLSSGDHSDVGATVAVRSATDSVLRHLNSQESPQRIDYADCFRIASQHVLAASNQLQVGPGHLAAVMTIGVMPTQISNQADAMGVFAAVGDVSAWKLEGARWSNLTTVKTQEADQNSLTKYLPLDGLVPEIVEADLQHARCIIISSDGIGDALPGPLGSLLAERWRKPPEVTSFIGDINFEQQTQLDDRTAVALWYRDPTYERDLA